MEQGYQPPPPPAPETVYTNQPGAQPAYGQQQYGQQPVYGQPGYAQPGQAAYTNPAYSGPTGAPPPPGPQPTQQIQWMQKPEGIMGCPPGLEYLTQIDQLLVKQKVNLLEAMTGWESKNKYAVLNSLGQQVYFAKEESETCMRQCCGSERGFEMRVTDNFGNEVLRVIRPFKCCAGCEWCAAADCCAFEVEVQSPVGQTCGYVRQLFSWCAPKYAILDVDRQPILNIEGPVCICDGCCCCKWDQDFFITSHQTGGGVGKISKQWSGLANELFTDADNFGVNFPMDLDVRVKATCLGAVFLIDFMYFEDDCDNNDS